jgi:hypothetical protein
VSIPTLHDYQHIAPGLGKIPGSIDCVYLHLPGQNPSLEKLKSLQYEE